MAAQNDLPDVKIDPTSLYREEVFTDRRAGTIRKLQPVTATGADDNTRHVLFSGQTQLLTPAGVLPLAFELEGEPPRVIRAGEAFWEPGGDVIHYSDGNNRDDMPCKFTVTMLCVPGKPMLELVSEDELEQRAHLRVPADPSA